MNELVQLDMEKLNKIFGKIFVELASLSFEN